jgi:hypothetical protein
VGAISAPVRTCSIKQDDYGLSTDLKKLSMNGLGKAHAFANGQQAIFFHQMLCYMLFAVLLTAVNRRPCMLPAL